MTEVIKECVASSVTEHVFGKVKLILLGSVSAYEQMYLSEEDSEDGLCECVIIVFNLIMSSVMDTEESSTTAESKSYWETFQKLVQLLNSLGLLQCFTAHAATVVVQDKVVHSMIVMFECLSLTRWRSIYTTSVLRSLVPGNLVT